MKMKETLKKASPMRQRLHRWSRLVLVVAAVGLYTSSPALAAQPVNTPCPPTFTLYDNTHYNNLHMDQYGLITSNILYESAADKRAVAAGQLPDEASIKMRIAQQNQHPGPLVLDFEDLYLTGSPATAAYHLRVLSLLATWAHAAAPGKAIGFYGLLNHTDQVYVSLAQQLTPIEDAFFPSMYTFNDNRTGWRRRLLDDMRVAKQIAPGKPILPYIWPQYHEGTPKALQYLDASFWRFQLRTLRRYVPGAVIWSGTGPNGSDGWVSATSRFMQTVASC